ncbi:phosphotransferase family protein [Streptosporangium sp. CA-115845]|uniref:phosphotransferase family protein n=1 Tax=Streptosporangium sp. CA-115845 TaxID=3240071 RepID=UPI003D924EAC
MTTRHDVPDTASVLDPSLREWVERLVGGRVLRARRMARWRPNYLIDVDTAAGEITLVLKGPRVPPAVEARSRMLSAFGTRREAAALTTLRDTGVAVPSYHGYLPEAKVLLIGRVAGSGFLQSAPAADRVSLMRQYARQLAVTHSLRWSHLESRHELEVTGTGPDRPGPLAAVLADYDVLRPKITRPDPLIDLAVWWLGRNAPDAGETCLLHGDAGPNQFMFDGDRLTALLDWEVAHLGHPLSDLGYTRFREALYPSGAFPEFVTEYAAASGRAVDRAVVDYYTVAAGVLLLTGMSSDVHRPRVRNPEALQHFWWDALARAGICQVLGESLGHPPLDLTPSPPHGGELSALTSLLADRIEATPVDNTGAPGGSAHTLLLARTVLRASRLRPDARDGDDAAELLGHRPADPRAQHAEITALVHEQAAHRLDDLVRYFSHQAVRRIDAVAPLAATDTWDRATDEAPAADDARLHGRLLPGFPGDPT